MKCFGVTVPIQLVPSHPHTMCVQQIRNCTILPCGSYYSHHKCHKNMSFRYITCGSQIQFLVTRWLLSDPTFKHIPAIFCSLEYNGSL